MEPPNDSAPEAEMEPHEDGSMVVFKVVSSVSTVLVLLLAYSLRVHMLGKRRPKKYKKIDTLPGPADAAHVEKSLQLCSREIGDRLVPELLRHIASSPVLLEAAKIKQLEVRELRQLRRELAACAPEWQESDEMGLAAAERQNLLLIYHRLYQQRLKRSVRLSDNQALLCDDVSSLVGQLLLTAFEAACKRQMLPHSLTLGRLIACFRLGLWSWDDPECVQLMRSQLSSDGTPYPRIAIEASVKSWMDAPCLAPSCTIELTVTVHREHAGASGASYQRMGWRGHEAVPIMESYTCIVSREVDGEGGAKGSMLGRLEVEVEQLTQRTATGSLKLFAPKQPGEYELRVACLSLVVLGAAAETVCRFTVVPHDHPLLQQVEQDDSDYE